MKNNKSIEKRILKVIDTIRPYLVSDGGDLQFIKFEDGIVYVKLLGACAGCSLLDITLKEGIEELLINEIPEVQQVVNI